MEKDKRAYTFVRESGLSAEELAAISRVGEQDSDSLAYQSKPKRVEFAGAQAQVLPSGGDVIYQSA